MYELIIGGCSGSNTPAHSRPKYGHLTSSYGLLDRENKIGLVIDNGTGVQVVGKKMIQAGVQKTFITQTHFHSDHLEGLQVNPLLFGSTIQAIIVPRFLDGKPFEQILAERFHCSAWPVSPETFGINHVVLPLSTTGPTSLDLFGLMVFQSLPLNHPGGCLGYRFPSPDGDIVIATDNELVGDDFCKQFGEFVSGAGILIADVQYTEDEYFGKAPLGGLAMSRKGWGHSTPEMLYDTLKKYCKEPPKTIYITHHDPSRTDGDLDNFYSDTCNMWNGIASTIEMARPIK